MVGRLASPGSRSNGKLSILLRIVLRLTTFFVVLLASSVALNRFRPKQGDLLHRSGSDPVEQQESASPALKEPLMVLLMGLAPEAEEQQLPQLNGALLVHLAPGQPVRLLQVPATTPVMVPGSGPVHLRQAYNIGGVRLVAELLGEHINQPRDLVDRYILSSSPALAAFVDAMGGVPMTLDPPPPQPVPLQDATDGRIASPGVGPWAELGVGARQLSGAQVDTYLRTSGPAPEPAWQLERQRRLLGAMTHHLDSEPLRTRWPRLAQDLLDGSRTNLSREELFSVLAMLESQPLRLVVEPLSHRAGAQARLWPRSRSVPGDTVLVEGPLSNAMALKRQLAARDVNAVVVPTPPDGIRLSRTRLLTWGAEPPASITNLLGNTVLRRQDAPIADAGTTIRLGSDWIP